MSLAIRILVLKETWAIDDCLLRHRPRWISAMATGVVYAHREVKKLMYGGVELVDNGCSGRFENILKRALQPSLSGGGRIKRRKITNHEEVHGYMGLHGREHKLTKRKM